MNLNNKTILITGGASGVGLEAAKQFLDLGARVIITGRNQQKLYTAKKLYPQLIAIKSDMGNAADSGLLFDRVNELGGIYSIQRKAISS